jgi:hypothetical protein
MRDTAGYALFRADQETHMRRSSNSLAGAWFDLAKNSMELMQGSASVIATRTTVMAAATTHPSPANDREMKRMVNEKVVASAASFAGMALSTAASCQSMFFASLLGGRTPTGNDAERALTKALGAGMAPYQKAVRSNLKRLRK